MERISNDMVSKMLCNKMNSSERAVVVQWAQMDVNNLQALLATAASADVRSGFNALHCLLYVQRCDGRWLQAHQEVLIDMLLSEVHTGKRRLLLSLLRRQSFKPDAIRTDFLDFCFSKINSECEPYAIRCFSLYCALEMCRFYPELVAELVEHLNLLELQPLSPGLRSALRTARRKIKI